MRILHVITSVNPLGGGPIEAVTQFNRALQGTPHMAEVVSLDDPSASWVAACPLTVHAQGPSRGGYAYSPQLLPWLRTHRHNYDAVIVEGIWQYGSFATWCALHGTDTPYWIFTHGMLDPWFKRTYPLKHVKKCLYWLLEYRVLRDAQAVCFTCEEERLLARQSFQPYKVRETVVSFGTGRPPGDANEQRTAFLKQFPHLEGQRPVLFLGRIHPKKGCDLLLEAFAKIVHCDPKLHLVMAGPDQIGWQAQLEKQAGQLGIAQRITWPGMLRGDLKWGAYHAAEVFILPSHQENFGITVAEALACGLPVLLSDKVNIWREVKQDEAGFVASDTVEGTAELLRQWLSLSLGEIQTMRQRGVECFEARFEIHQTVNSPINTLVEGLPIPRNSTDL